MLCGRAQGVNVLDANATILSIDGVGVLVAERHDGGLLPFVRLLHGHPSVFFVEYGLGQARRVTQGKVASWTICTSPPQTQIHQLT